MKDQIEIYQTEVGQTQIDVRLENETVWLMPARWLNYLRKPRRKHYVAYWQCV
jgi:hypothetical protein